MARSESTVLMGAADWDGKRGNEACTGVQPMLPEVAAITLQTSSRDVEVELITFVFEFDPHNVKSSVLKVV